MDQNLVYSILLYVVLAWSLFWKGIALWRASKNNQTYWFLVILVVNFVGILEIIYLFWFAKKRLTLDEMRGWTEYISNLRVKQPKKK